MPASNHSFLLPKPLMFGIVTGVCGFDNVKKNGNFLGEFNRLLIHASFLK